MNTVHAKNNIYKNGEYKPLNHSTLMAKENARSICPSVKQVEYRNALFKFCVQNGLVSKDFPLGRTKERIRSNINAFLGLLRRNGLADEFFSQSEKQTAEGD